MNKIKTTLDIVYNEACSRDITLVHISDVHFNIKTKINKLNNLYDYITNIKPDYVMITGDLIDIPSIANDLEKIEELFAFLTNLGEVTKVIISLGNHDVIMDEDYSFFNKVDDIYNVYVLNNSSYHDQLIYVLGITLPVEYYYNITGDESIDTLALVLDNLKNKISRMPKNVLRIAMIHSPLRLTEKSIIERLKDFNLILCGHTHNGMVPDMLKWLFRANRGIISPHNKFFPKIAKGKIECMVGNNKITIIINGAITKLSEQSGKFLSNFNFLYNESLNKIIIRKKRGIKYE